MIRDLITKHIQNQQKENDAAYQAARTDKANKLYVSGLGRCPRKAFLQLKDIPISDAFNDKLLNAFHNGNIWEDDTALALKSLAGFEAQLRLEDEFWSGKVDFKYLEGQQVVLVEHKATGDKYFDYKKSLPQNEHVWQLAMYGYLYKKQFGVTPKLILFYRSWGNSAEFEVYENEVGFIEVSGSVNGSSVRSKVVGKLDEQRQLFEPFFPDGLPERLENKDDGCYFNGKPGCEYFSHCWGSDE